MLSRTRRCLGAVCHDGSETLQKFGSLYRWFHDVRRQLPDWFAPVSYSLALFAVFIAAIAMLTTIGGAPAPHSASAQSEKRQVAERVPADTPETAPELSPVYPTMTYDKPASSGQAELARKLAREGQPTMRIPEPQPETSAYAPRFTPRQFRPEPLN